VIDLPRPLKIVW